MCGWLRLGLKPSSECSGLSLWLARRLPGPCGNGVGFQLSSFQLVQRSAIGKFFDCIQPLKSPDHPEMYCFSAAAALGEGFTFEQGHFSGKAMRRVRYQVNATGRHGCASRKLFRLTNHGPFRKSKPYFL